MMVRFKAAHFVRDIILTCARWYVAYPLSYRQLGVHTTFIQKLSLTYYTHNFSSASLD